MQRNLTLYVKTGCPYSKKVLDFAAATGIVFTAVKNRDEAGVRDDLIGRGGKAQFPYFVDEDAKLEMYESDDIVRYLGGDPALLPKVTTCALD